MAPPAKQQPFAAPLAPEKWAGAQAMPNISVRALVPSAPTGDDFSEAIRRLATVQPTMEAPPGAPPQGVAGAFMSPESAAPQVSMDAMRRLAQIKMLQGATGSAPPSTLDILHGHSGPVAVGGGGGYAAAEIANQIPVMAEQGRVDGVNAQRNAYNQFLNERANQREKLGSLIAAERGTADEAGARRKSAGDIADTRAEAQMYGADARAEAQAYGADQRRAGGLEQKQTANAGAMERLKPIHENRMEEIDAQGGWRLKAANAAHQLAAQRAGNKSIQQLADDLSGKGDFNHRDNVKRLNAAERALTLALDPEGATRNLSSIQMEELALVVGSVIATGNVVARQTIQNLTPHSITGEMNKVLQWLTNKPQGAEQQEFVKLLTDTAHRERQTVGTQLRENIGRKLPRHWAAGGAFTGADFDVAEQMVSGLGLSPYDFQPGAAPPRAPGTGKPGDKGPPPKKGKPDPAEKTGGHHYDPKTKTVVPD
jgi:hypothetical protein